MKCITSVSYQVLINGEAKGTIMPSRGLRQGDPLLPFLFILCTEVLISHIKQAEKDQKITGIKIARGSPVISHLLFAKQSNLNARNWFESLTSMGKPQDNN